MTDITVLLDVVDASVTTAMTVTATETAIPTGAEDVPGRAADGRQVQRERGASQRHHS
jgi:hypothetical protein